MKKTAVIFLIISAAEIFSYPFVIPYFDEEFFLYPYLNYDQSFEWKKTREGHLYEGGLVQTSHGSLTTWMLMSNEEAVINRDIGDDFTFRFRYRKYVNRHLSYDEQSTSAGFGYRISKNLSLMTETELSSEKSEIDLKPGLLYKFQTVSAYLGLSFTDILFDIKNIGDGKNNTVPLTFSTDIRFSFSRLYFFISGNYATGIDRTWTANYYTDKLSLKNHNRNLYARIEYDLNDYLKIYSENYYDDFYNETVLKDTLSDISAYKFTAKQSVNRIGSIICAGEKNVFDIGFGYAVTDHDFDLIDGQALTNGHAQSYTIEYPALLPYIIYKYRFNEKFTAETAYMGSYTVNVPDDNYYYTKLGEKYWNKELLKLGLEYRFLPNASLYISAGQLINTGVFGGGNARFNLFF